MTTRRRRPRRPARANQSEEKDRPGSAVGTADEAITRGCDARTPTTIRTAKTRRKTKVHRTANAVEPTPMMIGAMMIDAATIRNIPSGPRLWAASLGGLAVRALRGLAGVIRDQINVEVAPSALEA
jgi:hypothetical protein